MNHRSKRAPVKSILSVPLYSATLVWLTDDPIDKKYSQKQLQYTIDLP